jgi:hypothetical protein
MKLSKSTTKTLEMIHEALGEHSLSRQRILNGIHVSRLVECQSKMTNVQSDQAPAKQQKMLKRLKNSSRKTVIEQSTSLQILARSIMEFASGF